MNYIKNPNLPKNKVKIAIVDVNAREEIAELNRLGIKIIPTSTINNVDTAISTHPDIQICHVGNSDFITLNSLSKYYKEKILELGNTALCELFNNVYAHKLTGEFNAYPLDCKLNTVITENWVITHKKNDLFNNTGKKVIKTNQGYAKCSTCVVTDNAIITADHSIAKSAGNFGIDVCMVTNESIGLQGYKNGFIGGTCGKISDKTIAFYGNVKLHPDADKIISFCNNYGIDCISLSNNQLSDYGSLIPIIEE